MTANHSELINSYIEKLQICLNSESMKGVIKLSNAMKNAWESKKNIYICGNGGSAGNANHLANDFTYGVGLNSGIGMRIEALSSNPSIGGLPKFEGGAGLCEDAVDGSDHINV